MKNIRFIVVALSCVVLGFLLMPMVGTAQRWARRQVVAASEADEGGKAIALMRKHPDPLISHDLVGRIERGEILVIVEHSDHYAGGFTFGKPVSILHLDLDYLDKTDTAEGLQDFLSVLSHEDQHLRQWLTYPERYDGAWDDVSCRMHVMNEADADARACRTSQQEGWTRAAAWHCPNTDLSTQAALQLKGGDLVGREDCRFAWQELASMAEDDLDDQ